MLSYSYSGEESNREGKEEVGSRKKSGNCAGELWDTGRAEQRKIGKYEECDAAREE